MHRLSTAAMMPRRPERARRRTAVALLALAALASGCGDDAPAPPTASTTTTAAPALATRPAQRGEVVVRDEASPVTHGPYDFDGRYLVRFVQYAPDDPSIDFADEVAFSAALTKRAGDPRGGRELFEQAAASGRRELTLRGRYYVDVSFGDFPFALRFTPRD